MYSNLIVIFLLSLSSAQNIYLCGGGASVYCSSDVGLLRTGSPFNMLVRKHSQGFGKVASNLRKWLISFFLFRMVS